MSVCSYIDHILAYIDYWLPVASILVYLLNIVSLLYMIIFVNVYTLRKQIKIKQTRINFLIIHSKSPKDPAW